MTARAKALLICDLKHPANTIRDSVTCFKRFGSWDWIHYDPKLPLVDKFDLSQFQVIAFHYSVEIRNQKNIRP